MATPLDTPVAVRRAAMDLLARREHGRVELSRKLQRKGAPAELIESALDRLADEGLLNEGRYLDAYVASRARAGYGPLRIREELAQRGLLKAQVEEALQACAVDWSEALQELWRRRFGVLPGDVREKARQGRFLAYRGYSMEQISRVLRGVSIDD